MLSSFHVDRIRRLKKSRPFQSARVLNIHVRDPSVDMSFLSALKTTGLFPNVNQLYIDISSPFPFNSKAFDLSGLEAWQGLDTIRITSTDEISGPSEVILPRILTANKISIGKRVQGRVHVVSRELSIVGYQRDMTFEGQKHIITRR